MTKSCNPDDGWTPSVCLERFKNIDEKLSAIHESMTSLSVKVSNGLSEKINAMEAHVKILQEDRLRREKIANRYQTAFLSLMVVISTICITYAVRHYNTHVANEIKQELKP